MTIEFLREFILGVSALLFLCDGIRLAFKHNLAAGLMLGYGAIPFAVDSAVHHLYSYFLLWVCVCYIAFKVVYDQTMKDKEDFAKEFDNVLNKD